jgi:hypothetical protein
MSSSAQPGTAANQVFNIPELVDQILLLSSEDTYSLPVTHLFALQLVNTLFKDTIARNDILQQRMYANPAATSLDQIKWMLRGLRKHGKHSVWLTSTNPIKIRVNCHALNKTIPSKELHPFLRPEASWRKISLDSLEQALQRQKILKAPSHVEAAARQQRMTVFQETHPLFPLSPLSPTSAAASKQRRLLRELEEINTKVIVNPLCRPMGSEYDQERSFGENSTLGEIADWIVEQNDMFA